LLAIENVANSRWRLVNK